eukprot:3886240-Alexandrium_andersonii.AAC.1
MARSHERDTDCERRAKGLQAACDAARGRWAEGRAIMEGAWHLESHQRRACITCHVSVPLSRWDRATEAKSLLAIRPSAYDAAEAAQAN